MWSYVYNIMRICSNKRSEGAKPDDFTESRKPAVETAENLSNSHLGSLLPLKSSSPREDHLDHLELDQANTSEGKPKVISLSGFIIQIVALAVCVIHLKKTNVENINFLFFYKIYRVIYRIL